MVIWWLRGVKKNKFVCVIYLILSEENTSGYVVELRLLVGMSMIVVHTVQPLTRPVYLPPTLAGI